MKDKRDINKPKQRSNLRKFLGENFFILKRQIHWLFNNNNFALIDQNIKYKYSLTKHKSFLLRPLKDVDMYLQYNKVTNLKIAIGCINRVIIKPGQTFSFWKLVGKPTKSKGYLEGMTLHNGRVSKETGGGLCQLGNLLYWMALHTPLTIKERWRHGYDVFPDINRTIPFACGATLSYNYIDLQLENKTANSFQISLWLDEEYLNGEITSDVKSETKYEIYETDHIFKQQWWGGYTRHNKIWKKITNIINNSTIEELVAENNAIMMYDPLLEK